MIHLYYSLLRHPRTNKTGLFNLSFHSDSIYPGTLTRILIILFNLVYLYNNITSRFSPALKNLNFLKST
jgi:hypothetical protein